VVERVSVMGEKDGVDTKYSYLLIDFYDEETGFTAMQRTTGFPASIVSQMIGRGDIKEKGVINPGKIGWNTKLAEKFFSELKKRKIAVSETITRPFT
jgi:saccharopine dehydrogenase-like NADP-dependent oxidoreductase